MGHIGLEELSNTLKDHLKGLGITENQVNEAIKQITGDKTQLQTSNKTNLVAAINEVFQSGVNAKQGLVEALTSKDIETSTSESWDELNNKVKGIQGSPIDKIGFIKNRKIIPTILKRNIGTVETFSASKTGSHIQNTMQLIIILLT